MSDATLTIEPLGDATFGPCGCCGRPTRRVWGLAYGADGAEAAFFVGWVPGAVRAHGASFDLVVGRWGEGAGAADRAAVSLAFRHGAAGPEFMVVDAAGRHHARAELAGTALDRAAVVGTPIAARAYAIVDAIWLQDARVGELAAPVD